MVKLVDTDPIAEARARVALRYRRARPMHKGAPTIGHAAAKFARKSLPEPGAGLARLKAQWRDIVGEDIAKYCAPEKLTGKKTERTLTLRVIPQAAPLVQHRGEEIRQRVRTAVGGVVARLKLVQGPLPGAPEPKRDRLVRRALTAEEMSALERAVAEIQSPQLREATIALGKAMISARKAV
ncbi:MAG: DciA family protein [Hyphomonadaceae bacterium]|nr:DciA family protein [Hyphomonadaceae bacterium]